MIVRFVGSPPTSQYLSVARVREAVPDLAQATDARIIGLIKQASKIVDGFIGRRLGRARLIEAIDVGGDQMLLHYLPIVQLHAAGREGEPVEIETLEVLSFDYGVVLDLNNLGPATGVQGLWRWVRAARWAIEYTGGYALPGQEGENLPEDVQLATLDILRRLHADQAVRPDVVSESLDGYSYTLRRPEGALSPAAQDMLRPYRVLML